VSITGDAESSNLVSYNLAYGAGVNPTQWIAISGGDPKQRGRNLVMGLWDTTNLDGLYTLRLSITLNDNVFQLYTVQVTVDNKPPTLRVVAPKVGQPISPEDKTIKLEVEATDNVEIARVEFYHNDQVIDTVSTAPFRTEWKIDGSGVQSFYAIAYDTAGNSTRSDAIKLAVP